jgi:hypothetical protein
MRLAATLLTTALAILAPAVPAAGAGGPLSGTYGDGDVTVPQSPYRYTTVSAGGRGIIVASVRKDGGEIDRYRDFDGRWALPAVTIGGDAGGLSADGRTLVMIEPSFGYRVRKTSLLVLDTKGLRTRERLDLDGHFGFDAISSDGRLLYLVQYADPRDPLDYRVRAYDLAEDRFRAGRIVDPTEPDERMTGQPVSRQMSADGRWAYTLYGGGEETFIHALDTARATAVCVDLEQLPPRDLYRLALSVDPGSGEITVLRKGEPAAIVDSRTFAVSEPPTPTAGDPATAQWAAVAGGLALLAGSGALLVRRLRGRARDAVEAGAR